MLTTKYSLPPPPPEIPAICCVGCRESVELSNSFIRRQFFFQHIACNEYEWLIDVLTAEPVQVDSPAPY